MRKPSTKSSGDAPKVMSVTNSLPSSSTVKGRSPGMYINRRSPDSSTMLISRMDSETAALSCGAPAIGCSERASGCTSNAATFKVLIAASPAPRYDVCEHHDESRSDQRINTCGRPRNAHGRRRQGPATAPRSSSGPACAQSFEAAGGGADDQRQPQSRNLRGDGSAGLAG